MPYDDEEVDPHQPEMPDTRCVVPSEELCQPMQLHGLVNRPFLSRPKRNRRQNGEIRSALERVGTLLLKGEDAALAACQLARGTPGSIETS